jgi:hypothetical protein
MSTWIVFFGGMISGAIALMLVTLIGLLLAVKVIRSVDE